MRHWYVVHRRGKRLPPVAQAFKNFLLADGAAQIERIVALDAARRLRGWQDQPLYGASSSPEVAF